MLFGSLFRFLGVTESLLGRQGLKLAANCQRGISDLKGQSPPPQASAAPTPTCLTFGEVRFQASVSRRRALVRGQSQSFKNPSLSPSPPVPGASPRAQPESSLTSSGGVYWDRRATAPPNFCGRGPSKPRLGSPAGDVPRHTDRPQGLPGPLQLLSLCTRLRGTCRPPPCQAEPRLTTESPAPRVHPVRAPAAPRPQGQLHLARRRRPPALPTLAGPCTRAPLQPGPPSPGLRPCSPHRRPGPAPRSRRGRSRLPPAGALAEPPKSRRKTEPRKASPALARRAPRESSAAGVGGTAAAARAPGPGPAQA